MTTPQAPGLLSGVYPPKRIDRFRVTFLALPVSAASEGQVIAQSLANQVIDISLPCIHQATRTSSGEYDLTSLDSEFSLTFEEDLSSRAVSDVYFLMAFKGFIVQVDTLSSVDETIDTYRLRAMIRHFPFAKFSYRGGMSKNLSGHLEIPQYLPDAAPKDLPASTVALLKVLNSTKVHLVGQEIVPSVVRRMLDLSFTSFTHKIHSHD